jgi:4-diphosphocytidyl-2-C-methyl-D-erythritol kinase
MDVISEAPRKHSVFGVSSDGDWFVRRAGWIGIFDADIHNALSLLKLPSYAKINWTLRILGKRPDGYHEVVTVLQTISLHDELTFEVREDDQITLTCNDPAIPVDDSNLVVKAAKALNGGGGADITLTKRIPAKGGLGGASSNAAVTLLALNHLWRKELSNTDLLNIAGRLGADVPFFLIGGCAEGRGTGTELCPLADVPEYLIVVTPNAAVSTATAYASLKRGSLTTPDSASILSSSFARPVSGESGPWSLHNDFEVVIFEIEPEIERAKRALLDAGARGALLAGSGSSVFGIFDDEAARDRALSSLNGEAGWRVFPCHTLSRVEYLQALGPSGFPLLRSLKNWQADTGA